LNVLTNWSNNSLADITRHLQTYRTGSHSGC
jgi:hypothetical protein